ncbi:pyridoxamine 5'-phosphate oxidase family protein [Pseudonocardia kujensis]|uniref:pyridoxamine 5'-phosphate oxidase family protein n=1 Tax=Pseudonocardia kujensis TaxID=1128675 RepID=UPI001E44FC3E|nr:pyridoxamine 5'-phosphate oxidase family protein [Pseudonocardia kujensis]MCE0762281.1 pyridoxamine 5'-phosphate oxidase family protein [Pseudonocardia kujensis]
MDATRITEILTDPVTLELVERSPLMRIGYTGLDGAPRVVPLAYLLRAETFVFCTVTSSDKVPALQRDPRVAITIDVPQPLCCLLVRGTAHVEVVDGVPEEYLQASHRTVPAEQHEAFDAQVRGLYDSMARVVVTPTWVRLNDFQRTAPRAVERIVAAKS